MKAYTIPSPDKLREMMQGIKWDRDYKRVEKLAKDWERESRSGQQETVTIEIGKSSASIIHHVDGKRKLMATMYTAAARDFVKGLNEE